MLSHDARNCVAPSTISRAEPATTRLVVVLAFALFVVAGCTTAAKPKSGAEPAHVGRRQDEVIVVAPGRTLFFENARAPCPHWSLPGRWTFAQQPGALRHSDGRGFVGVALYPEQEFNRFPGADLVTRAAESFRLQTERDHGEPPITETEPFSAARGGAIVWRVTSAVAIPAEVIKQRPELAGQRAILPSRVLVPLPSGWLTVITVSLDDVDIAREVIATLETTDRPQCWLPMLRQQFPDVRW